MISETFRHFNCTSTPLGERLSAPLRSVTSTGVTRVSLWKLSQKFSKDGFLSVEAVLSLIENNGGRDIVDARCRLFSIV